MGRLDKRLAALEAARAPAGGHSLRLVFVEGDEVSPEPVAGLMVVRFVAPGEAVRHA